jgi:hypothetical protein
LLIPEIAADRGRSISLVRGGWVATGLLPAQNHWEGGTHVRLVERPSYESFLRYYIFGPPSLRERYRRRRLSPAPRGRPPEDELRDELFAAGRKLVFGEVLSPYVVLRMGGLLLAGRVPPLAGESGRKSLDEEEPRPAGGQRVRGRPGPKAPRTGAPCAARGGAEKVG